MAQETDLSSQEVEEIGKDAKMETTLESKDHEVIHTIGDSERKVNDVEVLNDNASHKVSENEEQAQNMLPLKTEELSEKVVSKLDAKPELDMKEYISSLEKRLALIETGLSKGDTSVIPPPPASPPLPPSPPSEKKDEKKGDKKDDAKGDMLQEAKIRRMGHKEWRELKEPMEFSAKEAAVLVCYNDADMVSVGEESTESKDAVSAQAPWLKGSPTRVGINSKIIAKVLTGLNGLNYSRTVLHHPFKALLTHEPSIRDAYRSLEKACVTGKATLNEAESKSEPAKSEAEVTPKEEESTPASEEAASKPTLAKVADETNKTSGPKPTDSSLESQGDDQRSVADLSLDYERTCRERDHLKHLIDFMDNDMQSIFDLRHRIASGTIQGGTIAYEELWHLFKPGDIVLSNITSDSEPRKAYCVLHVTGGRQLTETAHRFYGEPIDNVRATMGFASRGSPLVLDCFSIDYNGKDFGPRATRLILSDYNGSKPVASLEVVPIKFAVDYKETYKSLVQRGKSFAALCPASHRLYNGMTFSERIAKGTASWEPAIELTPREEVNSEVVLDQKAGIEYFEVLDYRYDLKFGGGILNKNTQMDIREITDLIACDHVACPGCKLISDDSDFDINARATFIHQTELLSNATKEELTESHFALLTPRMYGYALQERKWHSFDVEKVTDVETGSRKLQSTTTAFQDLVLPESHKALLQALVRNQTRQFQSTSAIRSPIDQNALKGLGEVSMDLVRGKGKGVIILLHGAPGVGKTSTAECVASQLQRPLFPITCGDLGVEATTVENRLREYFKLAQRWGCVLLLDEADVFLAKRSSDQLWRNALVSVFLRVLEYYAGVLMLTTNRVGEFDEAFRSRIHISLYYPNLDERTTSEIWEMNLRRIQTTIDVDIDIDEDGIKRFYEGHWKDTDKKKTRRWNGRQIKNAFQTALALANWEFHDGPSKGKLIKPHLKAKHFRKVAETSNHFDDYIAELQKEGSDSSEDIRAAVARREGLREDNDRGIERSSRTPVSRRRRDSVEETQQSTPEVRKLQLQLELAKLEAKSNKTATKKERKVDTSDEDDIF